MDAFVITAAVVLYFVILFAFILRNNWLAARA